MQATQKTYTIVAGFSEDTLKKFECDKFRFKLDNDIKLFDIYGILPTVPSKVNISSADLVYRYKCFKQPNEKSRKEHN